MPAISARLLSLPDVNRRISELERLRERHGSSINAHAISKEILQLDALRKLLNGKMVGIDELKHELPIRNPSLVRTLIRVASRFGPGQDNFKELVRIVNASCLPAPIDNGPFRPPARPNRKKRRFFIVHGRDLHTMREVKDFMQNELKLGTPIVLREQPSLGKTIIEKFEQYAHDVDMAAVILTPDDKVVPAGSSNKAMRRARQNVIFELGFFHAKLQRTSGRVLLLHKGEVELPSDISGIVYIDISDGVEAAGVEIQRELRDWLPK